MESLALLRELQPELKTINGITPFYILTSAIASSHKKPSRLEISQYPGLMRTFTGYTCLAMPQGEVLAYEAIYFIRVDFYKGVLYVLAGLSVLLL